MTPAPIPKLLYGTSRKEERTGELVAAAVAAGFRGFDTAGMPLRYNEPGVGEGLAASRGIRREDLFLQTKFSPLEVQGPAKPPYDPAAPLGEQVRQSFAASLKNLRTDHVDSLLLHTPLATLPDTLEAWRALEAVYRDGAVGRLGLSNFHDPAALKALHAAAEVKPTVLQNRFNAKNGYDVGVRSWCRDEGVAYQPFLVVSANPDKLGHRVLKAVARTRGKTPEQVLFRFLIEQGAFPLAGTTTESRMREALAVLDFELSPAEVGRLLPLFR